ncbi:MAG: hypothetical protein KDD40_11410, partial [Bdellovibrionales bacterium]|nr:hypothetical protein [Bdellovibrionales bacterium]
LSKMFGFIAHLDSYDNIIYKKIRDYGNTFVIDSYRQVIFQQYLIAAATLMTKILDTGEYRDSSKDRLTQELKYRLAQIKSLLGVPQKDSKGRNLVVFDKVLQPIRNQKGLQRRHFIKQKSIDKQVELEVRLWKIFFEQIDIWLSPQSEYLVKQLKHVACSKSLEE